MLGPEMIFKLSQKDEMECHGSFQIKEAMHAKTLRTK